MKPKIYWKNQAVSEKVILGIAIFSALCIVATERFKIKDQQSHYELKLKAAHLAKRAMNQVRKFRQKKKIAIDPRFDPALSGMIGKRLTSITSDTGSLSAKQTSINPNFAAVVVHYLKRAQVDQGDAVAVGVSGSFPALNLGVYAALEAIGAKPIIISSTSSSQWGANIPGLLWIDMERHLYNNSIFSFRSLASSIGGVDDQGAGLSDKGVEILKRRISINKLPRIDADGREDSVDKRMGLYTEAAGDNPIKAYINVGGGIASTGSYFAKKTFKPGLNRRLPSGLQNIDSVMTRFARRKVPVVHLIYANRLAQRFGLPLTPQKIPTVGQGTIFEKEHYSKTLVIVSLILIIGLLYLFIRSDIGPRALSSLKSK